MESPKHIRKVSSTSQNCKHQEWQHTNKYLFQWLTILKRIKVLNYHKGRIWECLDNSKALSFLIKLKMLIFNLISFLYYHMNQTMLKNIVTQNSFVNVPLISEPQASIFIVTSYYNTKEIHQVRISIFKYKNKYITTHMFLHH